MQAIQATTKACEDETALVDAYPAAANRRATATRTVYGGRRGRTSHASEDLHRGTKRTERHPGTESHPRTERGRNKEKTEAGTRRTSLPARHSQEAEGGANHVATPDIDALKACKCP